jgi:hypothetical protein
MKKFIITEEERSRILGMHQSATARQYLMEEGPKWVPLTSQKLNVKSWDITMKVSYLPVKDPQNSFYKAQEYYLAISLSPTQQQNLRDQSSNTSFVTMSKTNPDLLSGLRDIVKNYITKNQNTLNGIGSIDVEGEIKRLYDLFKAEYTKISSAQTTSTPAVKKP